MSSPPALWRKCTKPLERHSRDAPLALSHDHDAARMEFFHVLPSDIVDDAPSMRERFVIVGTRHFTQDFLRAGSRVINGELKVGSHDRKAITGL